MEFQMCESPDALSSLLSEKKKSGCHSLKFQLSIAFDLKHIELCFPFLAQLLLYIAAYSVTRYFETIFEINKPRLRQIAMIFYSWS